jgi:hypothetical protein
MLKADYKFLRERKSSLPQDVKTAANLFRRLKSDKILTKEAESLLTRCGISTSKQFYTLEDLSTIAEHNPSYNFKVFSVS